jgi:hypothetical protein
VKIANRTIRGLARGDRKWSLNEAQRPNFRIMRVALGTGYNLGEGNRRISRNGRLPPNPLRIPDSQLSHRFQARRVQPQS